jgi:hypothetical protein
VFLDNRRARTISKFYIAMLSSAAVVLAAVTVVSAHGGVLSYTFDGEFYQG